MPTPEEKKRAYELGYKEPITPAMESEAMMSLIKERTRPAPENLDLMDEYERGQKASVTDGLP